MSIKFWEQVESACFRNFIILYSMRFQVHLDKIYENMLRNIDQIVFIRMYQTFRYYHANDTIRFNVSSKDLTFEICVLVLQKLLYEIVI